MSVRIAVIVAAFLLATPTTVLAQTIWPLVSGSTYFDASTGTTEALTGTLTTSPMLVSGGTTWRHNITDIAITGSSVTFEESAFGGGVIDINCATEAISQVQIIVGPGDSRFTGSAAALNYEGRPEVPLSFILEDLFPFIIGAGSPIESDDRLTLHLAPPANVTVWTLELGSSFFDASTGVTQMLQGTLTTRPLLLPAPQGWRHEIVDIDIVGDTVTFDEASNGGGTIDIDVTPDAIGQVEVIVGPGDSRFTHLQPRGSFLGTPENPTEITLLELAPSSIDPGSTLEFADRLNLFLGDGLTQWPVAPGSTYFDVSTGLTEALTGTISTTVPQFFTSVSTWRHNIVDIDIVGATVTFEEAAFGGGALDISVLTDTLSQIQVIVGPGDSRFGVSTSSSFVGSPTVPTAFALNDLRPFSIDPMSTIEPGDRLTLLLGEFPLFARGDANLDDRFDLSDPVFTLQHLFLGASIPCELALDSNDDNSANLVDVFFTLDALFGQGPLPPVPFPTCGGDIDVGGLTCEFPAVCP